MSLLTPGFLLAGLLAVPILVLYMLKLRRKDVSVSSTLLWTQLLRDRQANTPWQRLRRNLLLFLQLLILAALVLALARPAVPVPGLSGGETVILLDGSASMNATDVAPTRFEAARAKVRALIAGLPANAPVTLILAGGQPRLLSLRETDHTALLQSLDGARTGLGKVDWPAAFALAAGVNTAAARAATLIVSDGGVPQTGLPALAGDLMYLPVGRSADNLAISALSVRASGSGAQLFASAHNYGTSPREVILSVYAGEALLSAREVTLQPGQSQDVVLDGLSNAVQRYSARLSSSSSEAGGLDALPQDDAAYTVYQPPAGGRTLLVSPGNVFLRQLLQSLPGVQPFVLVADAAIPLQIPKDRYDVYVFDGVLPADSPAGNLLLVNPPENPFFKVTGTLQQPGAVQLADSPLLRFVKWDNVHVLKARQVELPAWATALVSVKGGPLVFVGETGGRRLAVVTFDLHDSDLPLQVSYPILFSNLIQYLSKPSNLSAAADSSAQASLTRGANLQVQPGESIRIQPAGAAASARVTAPDGSRQTLTLDQGQAVYNATDSTGFYTVDYPGHPELGQDAFAVDLFDPVEAAIAPRESLTIGQVKVLPQAQQAAGRRELWPWLAALALAVLVLEWLLYQRSQGWKWPRFAATKAKG